MKYLSLITILLLTLGCQTKEDHSLETAVLDKAITEAIEYNVDLYDKLLRQVRDTGDRPEDVALLKKVEDVINLRVTIIAPYAISNKEKIWPKDSVISYLNAVERNYSDFEIEDTRCFFKEKYENSSALINRVQNIVNVRGNLDWKAQRIAYLSVLQMERSLVYELVASAYGYCNMGAGFPLNRFPIQDSIKVKKPYTFYLSPAFPLPLETSVEFIKIKGEFEKEEVVLEQEIIDGLIKVSFVPENTGTYVFKGKLVTQHNNINYENSLNFNNTIHVVE